MGILTPALDSPEGMSPPLGDVRLPGSAAGKPCIEPDELDCTDFEANSGLDQAGKLLARAGPEGEDTVAPNLEPEGL